MRRTKSFTDHRPILYMIATPIGNLKEMTPYALEVLTSIDAIFCEDTRNTKSLLQRFDIHKECYSLREHNETSMTNKVLSLLEEGKNVAYMSDAGYPAISDPGKILVKKVREAGYSVTTISGSNAMLSALVSSSRNSDHFYFHGFLSAQEGKAKEELEALDLAIKALEERTTGHWIEDIYEDYTPNHDTWECSNCGEPYLLMEGTPENNKYNYCPNCGARMGVRE